MFEKYLQKILKQILGEFIEQIDSKELSVGIWSGKIEIKNLKIKKNILQKHHLPITITHSCIKGLSLKIPWKNLFGSPLVITVQSVLILCQFANESIRGEQRLAAMMGLIENTIKQVGSQIVEKTKQKIQVNKKSTLIDRLSYKMLDNLYLSIKNIHFRFEEKQTPTTLKYGYSFGCSLQSIDVFAVGPNNQKVFIDRSKLQASQTLLRKKIQMKNLSIYCNYGEADFITTTNFSNKNEKAVQQKLLKMIYTRQKFDSNQNKNYYILIMNVLGFMNEDHRQEIVSYDLNLNFQKLIVKLDKQVLNCILIFIFKLKELDKKYNQSIVKKQLAKQDEFLFRKYCNGYFSDFKAKDLWTNKDKQQFSNIIMNLDQSIVVDKIKYIIINQMSVAQLSKFFLVKGQDLDKGLLEVSKQIKDLEPPKLKMKITIPQITLYLVSQFSQSILQLNILSISLSYHEKIVADNKNQFIDFYIQNISAVNNGLYILSADQQAKAQNFFASNMEVSPNLKIINCKISSFNFNYDFQTIFKINELFNFKEVENRYRNMALNKLEQMQNKMSNKVKSAPSNINLNIIIYKPKIFIRQGKLNWSISLNQVQINYNQNISLKLESFKIVIYRDKEEYLFIKPFDTDVNIQLSQQPQQSKIKVRLSSIVINFEYFIYSSLNNLKKYLFINKKNEIINKCKKSGQVFYKQNRWKKCYITLLDKHLYAWQNQNDYPLFSIRIKVAEKVKRGKIDILQISDKKKVYEIAFKDAKFLEEWLAQLKSIVQHNNSEQKSIEVVEVKEDSKFLLQVYGDMFAVQLNHHCLKQDEKDVNCDINAVTEFKMQGIKLSLKSTVQNNIKASFIALSMSNIKFKQNKQNFIFKTCQQQELLKLQIIDSSNVDASMVEVQINPIQFYYKPVAILKLIGFFNNMEQTKQSVSYQQSPQQISPKVLNDVNIKIKGITVVFQNKIISLPIAKLTIAQLNIHVLMKQYETALSANISNINLFDLTNYPNTIYNKKDKNQVKQRCILSSHEQDNELTIQIKLYSQAYKDIYKQVKSTANVNGKNLNIYHIHQVILRIIDYLNNQILAVAFYPQFFIEFYCQNIPQRQIDKRIFLKEQKDTFKVKYLNKLGKQKVKLMLQTSNPLLFNIELIDSKLNIIIDYISSEVISLLVQKALISNKIEKKHHQTSIGNLQFPHDIYLIELKNVKTVLSDHNQYYFISNEIGEEEVWLKIRVDYFGSSLDYMFISDVPLELQNQVQADIGISIVKLHINENIISNILRALNNNIFHEDGIYFLMNYEIVQGVESKLKVNLFSELLVVELKLIEQKASILAQMGGFLHSYQRNNQCKTKSITSKYIIFNYVGQDNQCKEVFTSRKIFGRKSSRGTFYKELLKQNLLINLSKDTSFQYESSTNRKLNRTDSVISARELMAILNIDFIIYLQKIRINQQKVTISPVYCYPHKQQEQQSNSKMQLKLDKILLCAQVADSNIIISLLLTIYANIDPLRTQILMPDLQAFISSTQHITCNELSQMKKRTLLKQTQLKIIKQEQFTQVILGKCFFKISINDIKNIYSIFLSMNEKYRHFLTTQKAFNDVSKQVQSIDYLSEKQKIQKEQSKQKLTPVKKIISTNSKLNIPLSANLEELDLLHQKSPLLSPNSSLESMSKEFTFNLDTIQVMIVDDLNDFITPLIYVNAKLDLNQPKKAIIELYADYFNLRNTLWQPLMQKNILFIDYAKNMTIKSADPKQFININIASNFIENIFKTINHKQLKSSRLLFSEHQVDRDQINSWIIINELGEDICCWPLEQDKQQKKIYIPRGQVQTLTFLSKAIVREFKENESQQIFIKVRIGEKLVLKKLKINELGLKRLYISNGSGNSIAIIKNLFIDLSKNVKYLTLSSQIIFENKSDITIRLKQNIKKMVLYLMPFKSSSLPYYCNLGSVLYSKKQETYNQNQQIKEANLQDLQHCTKLQINNRLFNITFRNKKFKKYFTFHPLYKITNYLPFSLNLNFKFKDRNSLYCSLQLSSYQNQEHNFGYLYQPLQILQTSLCIDNFQYTDFFTIQKFIQIKDYNNNNLTIRSYNYKDASSPMLHIALLVNFIIKNQSKQVFDIYVDNHWRLGINQGDYFISQKNQINLLLNGSKSDSILLTKKFSYFSISNKEKQIFKTECDYCLFKNQIQFDHSNQNRMNFYISEILPLYLFRNDNKYSIILRQHESGVGQYQLIQPKTQQNIKWFMDGKNRRKNVLFKFTIQDSPYEWSCLINIQVIKKSYFIIRNKFNYQDIKYFMVNVKKVKESYDIYCKELADNQVPYLIKNYTQNYCIFIQNLKVTLKPKQQTYFCWEDPSINQKKIKIIIFKSTLSLSNRNGNKKDFINYQIKADTFELQPIKSNDQNLDIQSINQINRQVYIFTDKPKNSIQTIITNTLSIQLPIRIALINNSSSPAHHIFDLTTLFGLHYQVYSTNKTVALVDLNEIQLDNQTKPLTYFPVVLSTNLQIRMQRQKYLQVQVLANYMKVSIQQDFITDLTAFLAHLQVITSHSVVNTTVLQQHLKQEPFFISKLILPKITVQLQIQTKKFSIQTTINLQKPQITSYPWKNIPYPIKTIAVNILSHLSISPWAFITSFGKGLSILITQQQTTKGFQGFFQQLIGGFSNSINGMVGMIVGHDIEKVDNFVDGVSRGFLALATSLYEILPNFQGDYSPINIIKEVGKSAVNLIFKPVTGILRMTLKISEGIKKTTKFEFDLTSKKFKKRFAIIFYQRQQTFHSYDHTKSQLMNKIGRTLMNELKYFYLVDTFPIQYKLRNERYCLLIGAQQLLLFNIKSQKIIWRVQIQKITNIQIHNLCTMQFITNNQNNQGKKKFQVDINSQQSVKKVQSIIQKAKKYSVQL